MRHKTPEETACLTAVMMMRSGQNRARLSAKTIKFLSGREYLRGAFVSELRDALAEFGWVLCEIESGYGVEKASLLEAAKAVTAKRWLDTDLRRSLRHGYAIDFETLEKEVFPDEEGEEVED